VRFLSKIPRRGSPTDELERADPDDIPRAGLRTDEAGRHELAQVIQTARTRREVVRLAIAAAGGAAISALATDRIVGLVRGAPGDAIGGTTISDTDVDAKRIAAIRVATEFDATKHAGTAADPWTEAGINAAMADLGSGGGLVYLPTGFYRIRPITIPANNIRIMGSGFGTQLVAFAGTYVQNSSAMFLINGKLGITISDMALDGTGTNTCFGVNATGGSDPILARLKLTNWLGTDTQRGRGITIQQNPNTGPPFYEGLVLNCVCDGNQIGVVVHRTRFMVIGCRADNHPFDGMYIDGNQAQGSMIGNILFNNARTGINAVFSERCTLADNTSYQDGTGIQLYSATRMVVEGNTINEALAGGILLTASTKYSTIAKNWIYKQAVAGQSGIVLYNGCLYNLIHGNVCAQNAQNGIWVYNNSNENLIADNLCFNNSATNSGFAGIAIGSANNVVRGNRCFDDQATPTQAYGIMEVSPADLNFIVGNKLTQNGTGALLIVGPNTVVRQNLGYVTENQGSATIPAGSSSVTVPHGLAKTPAIVTLGPRASQVSGAYVSSRDATNITISVPAAVGAGASIDWYAQV
jgi:parallel beta-helix repeat protein